MLSIARAAAEGARAHCETLIELVRSARDRAKDALAFTPEQLPVLKQAGVVDSGGHGTVVALSTRSATSSRTIPLPVAPSADSITVHVHEETEVARVDDRGPALRGHVLPRRRGRQDARLSRGLVGHRRLHRHRRWRRSLQLPHPHRQHWRRRRGGARRRTTARHPRHRPHRTGDRRALGPRRKCRPARRASWTRPRRRRSSRSSWATASVASFARSACASSSPAVSR